MWEDEPQEKPKYDELAPWHQESFGVEQQDCSPSKANLNVNEQLELQEKSSSYSAYNDFINKPTTIQYSNEKPNMFADKYSEQTNSQNITPHKEEIKDFDYEKYSKENLYTSNNLYDIYKRNEYQVNQKNDSSGSQKEVSPKFNDPYSSSAFMYVSKTKYLREIMCLEKLKICYK